MENWLSLGTTPCDESCAQVGSAGYRERAVKEADAYRAQLLRMFGLPPIGAAFCIKSFPHDFGTYYELCICYDDSFPAKRFSYVVEAELPAVWDNEARAMLGLEPRDAQPRT